MSSTKAPPTTSIHNWVDPKDKTGEFKRAASSFRNWVEDKPDAEFPAEKGRYHLYASYACPWAHRTLIVRKLKGLEDIIPFTSVHWHLGEQGWRFVTNSEDPLPGEAVTTDPHHPDFTHLRQLYFESASDYAGRFTVPVLYDHIQHRIVNNESSEIIRMFNTSFDSLLPESSTSVTITPPSLLSKIDSENAWIYDDINNGVYKSGFATSQEAYERNVKILFDGLDKVEAQLKTSDGPYYFGKGLTETDVRLYTTMVRFDPVYVQHFKCNIRDVRSGYPAIHKWLRHLYWDLGAFKDTTEFEHIRKHYTKSHRQINPFSISPVGPLPNIFPKDEEVNAVSK